jgi:hypothetical protein
MLSIHIVDKDRRTVHAALDDMERIFRQNQSGPARHG